MSLWITQQIEELLQEKLNSEFKEVRGGELFADYVSARKELLENVLQEIKANEPSLTDHGPDHIADVLTKAYELIEHEIDSFTAIELYVLCVSILFHDVGNFEGRKGHNKKVAQIYDHVRKKASRFSSERTAVISIAGAHTGFCSEGTVDTLKELGTDGVYAKPVNLQKIAALLRFADELAEGPQRTSTAMQKFGKYDESSKLFHQLANATQYTIDRENSRIQINYTIYLVHDGETLTDGEVPVLMLLNLMINRVIKVNAERQYCSYYCSSLSKFKEISVKFQFIYDSEFLDVGLKPLVLNDLVLPSSVNELKINEYQPDEIVYKLQAAVEKIREA